MHMWYSAYMHDHGKKDTVISITTGTIVKAIAIIVGFWILYILRDLILVVVTAVIIASSIEPLVKFLGRNRIPRIPAVLFVYLSLAGLFAGVFYSFVPPLLGDFADFSQKLPSIATEISTDLFGGNTELLNKSKTIIAGVTEGVSPQEIISILSNAGDVSQGAVGTIGFVFGGIFSLILIIVLSFYFAMQEHGIQNFLRIIIPFGREDYAINLWERSKVKIGKWMQGQLLLGVLIFVLVYLGLTIFAVPYALTLALIAGALEIIPVFGPIISAIPAVVLAFSAGGTTLALIITIFYVLVQQFESHLIYPLVVRKIVGLPPIMVILALIVGFNLAGILGVLIAVPVAAALMELVEDIEKKKGLA